MFFWCVYWGACKGMTLIPFFLLKQKETQSKGEQATPTYLAALWMSVVRCPKASDRFPRAASTYASCSLWM